jgi:pimeloyl-ACP methyl ester carboxylesterase
MGHSLGGYIAQEIGINHPNLVEKLVLASTTHGGKEVIPITPEAYKLLTDRSGDPVDLIKRGVEVASAPGFSESHPDIVQELIDYRFTNPVPPEQYQAQVAAGIGMAGMPDENVRESLKSIKVPALVLFGEFDRVVPPGNADLLAEKLPDVQVKIIPNTGHIFPIEDPATTSAILKEFL